MGLYLGGSGLPGTLIWVANTNRALRGLGTIGAFTRLFFLCGDFRGLEKMFGVGEEFASRAEDVTLLATYERK